MKIRFAMLLCILFMAACSKNNDDIKILMDYELQGSGENVAKVEESKEVGLYCKMMKITTDRGNTRFGLFRFKNGRLDEHFHPNYTTIRYESEFLHAQDSAMCN